MTITEDDYLTTQNIDIENAIDFIETFCASLMEDAKALLRIDEKQLRTTLQDLSDPEIIRPNSDLHQKAFDALLKLSLANSIPISFCTYEVLCKYTPYLSDDNFARLENNLKIAKLLLGPPDLKNASTLSSLDCFLNRAQESRQSVNVQSEASSNAPINSLDEDELNRHTMEEIRVALQSALQSDNFRFIKDSVLDLTHSIERDPSTLSEGINICIEMVSKSKAANGSKVSKCAHDIPELIARQLRRFFRAHFELMKSPDDEAKNDRHEKINILINELARYSGGYVRKHLARTFSRILVCEGFDERIDSILTELANDKEAQVCEQARESISIRAKFTPDNSEQFVEREFYVPETALAIN